MMVARPLRSLCEGKGLFFIVSHIIKEVFMEWYNKKSEEIEQELQTSLSEGLSTSEAKTRLSKYGPNALEEGKKKTIWAKLAEQIGRAHV